MPQIVEINGSQNGGTKNGAVEHSEGFKNIQHTHASSATSLVKSFKVVHTEFTWTIKDYSHHEVGKAALISPAFYTEPKEDGEKMRWYLNCYVGCNSDKASPEHVSVFLSQTPNMVIEYPPRNWEVELYIVRAGGYKVKKNYGSTFCEKAYLQKNKESLLPENTLTVHCVFKTTTDISTEPDPKTTPTADLAITTVNKNLFADFSSALNNGKFSDVILVSGGQKFRVHKGILASRSPVFDQLFKKATVDGTSEVTIDDVSPIVLWEFLRYIYTGDIVNLEIRVEDLFVVADKYDVPTLADITETHMIHNLTIENVSRCLILGHNHKKAELKKYSMKFIAENGDQVIQDAEWKKVEAKYPMLVVEAFRLVFRMPVAKSNVPAIENKGANGTKTAA